VWLSGKREKHQGTWDERLEEIWPHSHVAHKVKGRLPGQTALLKHSCSSSLLCVLGQVV